MTTFEIYCEWFLKTYGRPFEATKAQFEAAVNQPSHDGRAPYTQADFEFDVETERREGWGYDQ